METKKDIRKRLLQQRSAMCLEDVTIKSDAIVERICALKHYRDAQMVLVYMDYRNEVMTGKFISRCKLDRKRIALPKVELSFLTSNAMSVYDIADKAHLVPDYALSVYEIDEVERDTLAGFRGIAEPNSAVLNRLEPTAIDLAIIPGVAFDYDRHRIGYGAGYYDRFLTLLKPDCIKVGVAYSLQLVDKILTGEYDMPMDLVITEDMVIE